MAENSDRVEQFTEEVAKMNLPQSRSSQDRKFMLAGAVLMGVGIAIGVAAYFVGHGTTNALQQRDAIVIAIVGATVSLVGSALFIRYSIGQFLRFWLARNAWEQAAQTDRLIEAMRSEQ